MTLGDVDGDGDLDLVTGNSNAPNRIYINNGAGNFTGGQALGANNTFSVTLGDVDGDGDLDLLAGNGSFLGQLANRVYVNLTN